MSGGLLKYSGLVTKTKAMHGKLLSKEEIMRLAEYETVEDFLSFLRESDGYSSIYRSHEEIQHRAQVEEVIDDSLYADYGRLYRFADSGTKQGLEILFFRYEVNVLKICLEHVYQGGDNARLGYLKVLFDRHASFHTEAVTQAERMTELQQALAGTKYENLWNRFLQNEGNSFADCVTQLDIFYYNTAWQMCKKLSDKRMKYIFTRILGTEIDWQNIMWMYRSKRFYNQKTSDLYANMIPITYRIRKEEMRRLLDAEQLEEFVEILGKSAYFTEKDPVVKLGDEITYRRVIDETYRKLCRKYPMSVAPVLAYLYDKEREIDTLTTILEGVRYQMPAREIQELVLSTS